MRCALLRLGLSATLALANSSAFAQSDEIINFEHTDRAEFAIHLDWLDLATADEETLVLAVYEDYLESAKDLEQSWLLVLNWSGRWREEIGATQHFAMVPSDWPERLSPVGNWESYRRFVADEIEIFQQRYFDDLRAVLLDRVATIERLERLRFRSLFFRPKRSIYFRDTPDLIMLVHEIAPDAADDPETLDLLLHHELEMEALLKEFEAAQARLSDEHRAAVDSRDAGLLAELWREPLLARMHMRVLTRRTAAALVIRLDENLQTLLRERLDETMYPSVSGGWPGGDRSLLSATSTAHHLLRQVVLTAAERARLDAILAAVDGRRNAALPGMRQRYDDLFTRKAIEESAEAIAENYLNPTGRNVTFGEWAWQEWANELHTGFDTEIAEIRAIAVAVGERPGAMDAGAPPAEVSDGSTEPLWITSATAKQVDEAMQILAVDEALAAQVRDIMGSFRHAFTLESLRVRVAMGSLMAHFEATLGADSPSARRRTREMRLSLDESWLAYRREREQEFVEDVAALLTAEQAERWRTMHAQWHRARMLEYIAERLQPGVYDLANLLAEAQIPAAGNSATSDIAAGYHAELDAAIEQAISQYPARYAERGRIEEREGRDSPEVRAAWDRVMDLGRAVAAVNERSLPLLFEALNEADAERLRQTIDRRRFPGVYHESPVERVRTLFAKLDDLPEESAAQLDAIFAPYSEREQQLRRRLVEAIERWRSPGNAEWIQRRQQELTEAGRHPGLVFEEHPALPIFEEENQFVARTLRQIRGIFSTEEFDALPPQIRILTFWVDE